MNDSRYVTPRFLFNPMCLKTNKQKRLTSGRQVTIWVRKCKRLPIGQKARSAAERATSRRVVGNRATRGATLAKAPQAWLRNRNLLLIAPKYKRWLLPKHKATPMSVTLDLRKEDTWYQL